MGYRFSEEGANAVLKQWKEKYHLYAPTRMIGKGAFSDTDVVRYESIDTVGEIEFIEKSTFSFKEILLPLSETLFYFTKNQVTEAAGPNKGAIVFLRSCDLHAVKRLDEIFLRNGAKDYYYRRMRDNIKFILLGCERAFENCFCVDMQTNRIDTYDASLEKKGNCYEMDNQFVDWEVLLAEHSLSKEKVTPAYVKETQVQVSIPQDLSIDVAKSTMWDEYNNRCINCGRCNFVCPTCTCFTMQDIFYTDNGKIGERRRVSASCMVDGYTDVAGGGAQRQKNGQRMRFRVLHKVYDYKKRFGYHMCTGCGRCDDVCPEYISFSHCINKLESAVKEVSEYAKK